MLEEKDELYLNRIEDVPVFQFDRKVANVFSDMINRSVPGYAEIVKSIITLSKKYAMENTKIYDLGCSLGAVSVGLKTSLDVKNVSIYGVDNSLSMLNKAIYNAKQSVSDVPIYFIHNNIENINIDNASVVILNFTLQFIPIEKREALLQKIYKGLKPGGVLILSEKVQFSNRYFNDVVDDLHCQFKQSKGYSQLEIAQKRTALEDVMIVESISTHQKRLERVGFSFCEVYYQYYNFCSMLVYKS